MYQTINLDKKEIDDNIKYHKFNEFNEMLNIKWPVMILPETVIHCLRKEIKSALSELNHSCEGTYRFLCQDNSVFLYGLYKGEDSKIYLVKSFMDSIILVVKYERKLLHRN
jgi:hypothetical protein